MSRAEVRCNLFRKEFHEGQLSGASCSGGSYSGKTVLGTKVQVPIALRGISWGAIVQGDCLVVIVRGDKSPGVNCPGENLKRNNFSGGSCPGWNVGIPIMIIFLMSPEVTSEQSPALM